MIGVFPTSSPAPKHGVADYRLTPRALADLDAIADYSLEQWGRDRTERYLKGLTARMALLAETPSLGRDRSEVVAGYRSFPEGRHLVFYIEISDGIAIIGVPHASMDMAAHFD